MTRLVAGLLASCFGGYALGHVTGALPPRSPTPDSLGFGTFLVSLAPQLHLATGTGPGVVVVSDLNSDGYPDIIVANERGGDASVFLGKGRRAFSLAAGSPVPAGPNPNDLTVGDFNKDGHADLAFANHETQGLTVLIGDGHGRFVPAPYSPVRVAVRPHPHGVAAADFNGDGFSDLVTDSWGENRLEVLLNPGEAAGPWTRTSYVPVGRHPYQRIRVADLNGDGHPDIVSPNLDGGDVTILLGDGAGGFRQPKGSPYPCGDAPFNVAVGDINGDGVPDLAIVNSPSSTTDRSGRDGLTVLLGDGNGGFRAVHGAPFGTDRYPNLPAIGDLDGDGIGDIVVSLPESDHLTVFYMARDGTLKNQRDIGIGGGPRGVAIRDLDGDGKPDIVVSQHAENAVTVLFGR